MTQQYFDVEGKWSFLLCYNINDYDYIEMARLLRSFGMDRKSIKKSLSVLSGLNTGMTVSKDKKSIVIISDTTTESQWWNTLNHELLHLGTAIIDYYGVPYDGERAAYLQGYLMQMIVEQIAPPCY